MPSGRLGTQEVMLFLNTCSAQQICSELYIQTLEGQMGVISGISLILR